MVPWSVSCSSSAPRAARSTACSSPMRRLQPILVTLATLSILQGLAIRILPEPGGSIPTRTRRCSQARWAVEPFLFVLRSPFSGSRCAAPRFGVRYLRDRQRRVRRARARDAGAPRQGDPPTPSRGCWPPPAGCSSPRRRPPATRRRATSTSSPPSPRSSSAASASPAAAAARSAHRRRVRAHVLDERPLLRRHRSALPVLLPGALPVRRGPARSTARTPA